MRILYHHRTASLDGQEVHIRELVSALREQGHEVAVVAPGRADAGGSMGGLRGGLASLRSFIPDRLMPLAARAYEEVFTRRLISAGRRLGADFLYERHALDNRVGVRASRALDVPLLLEVNAPLAREEHAHGRVRDFPRALKREVRTLREADAVLVVTRVLKEILSGDGVPAERIHVIPNAVSEKRLLDPPRSDAVRRSLGLGDRLVLGFVGFPRPWHGLDRVVRVMSRAGGPLGAAVLLIGGEGPALPSLLSLARELGVADRVMHLGVVQRDSVAAFVDAFDIALQPHATEYASPLKLFEYLARGVAVVAPDQPNLREVLCDGENAVLFDKDDDEGFAQAIERLAQDLDLRRRIGEAGRRRVVEGGFTWKQNARRVLEIARGLREGRGA